MKEKTILNQIHCLVIRSVRFFQLLSWIWFSLCFFTTKFFKPNLWCDSKHSVLFLLNKHSKIELLLFFLISKSKMFFFEQRVYCTLIHLTQNSLELTMQNSRHLNRRVWVDLFVQSMKILWANNKYEKMNYIDLSQG